MQEISAESELDRLLLARFCAGDEGSFTRLLARHRAGVVGFLQRMTSDLGLAEDLGQEVFVRVYQKAADFRGDDAGTVRSWIYAIARHLVIDHSRVKHRMFGRGGRAVPLDLAVGLSSGEPPDVLAQRHEVQRHITEAVAALTEPYRSAVALVDIARLSYEEAALALGCGIKTLSSRVTRARRMLRGSIDPALLESLE